jgi:hypothetical protein
VARTVERKLVKTRHRYWQMKGHTQEKKKTEEKNENENRRRKFFFDTFFKSCMMDVSYVWKWGLSVSEVVA